MSDFESELTDIESDEYTQTKKKKKPAAKSGKSTYKIKNALKVPRATTYTAQALYEQIHSCDINLEPEYQRDVVWPESKQIGIIDSVFRNFYIPPVIFSVNTFEDGSETKTCIDGKQRLTSIHKFMDGLIPHKDPLTGEKLWYKDVQTTGKASRARRLLPDEYRKTFANKQIVCVEYQDITDSDEREIFQRVQLGMALTPSEKLQVINSARAGFIRELQTTYLKEDGWLGGDSLEWDRSRGSDFRCLSQAIYCMEKFSDSLKGVTIIQLEKWLNLAEPFTPDFRAKVTDAYRIFAELVQDRTLNKVFKKPAKVSPVEFTTIGLLVFVHKDTLTLAQLSAAIEKLRGDVRATYVDIRMNSRVMKSMIDFIKTLKMPKIPGDTGGSAGATGSTAGLKRKRAAQQSSEDEDDEDNDKAGDAKPKSKKSTTVSTATPSSSTAVAPTPTPKAPLPMRVKAEPGSTPVLPTQAPKPHPPDRMAALRRAKDTIAQQQQQQQQQQQHSALSTVPMPNPQMLPSPGPSFTLLSSQAGTSVPNQTSNPNSYNQNPITTYSMNTNTLNQGSPSVGPNTTVPAASPLGALESFLATMMRSNAGGAPAPISQQQQPLPPPPSAGSSSTNRDNFEGGSYRDRDWDRDVERGHRDRNYGPLSTGSIGNGVGGRYHDYDERHGSHRRRGSGSHGYGRKSPDEYSGGRMRGWRA